MSTQGELSKSAVPPDFGYVRTQKSFHAGYTAMLVTLYKVLYTKCFSHTAQRLVRFLFLKGLHQPPSLCKELKTYSFLSQLLYLILVKISQTQKNVNQTIVYCGFTCTLQCFTFSKVSSSVSCTFSAMSCA